MALDYSTAPPRWRRRIRWITISLLIFGVAGSTWRWGPVVREYARFRYVQWQCLIYSASPDLVVYESNPQLVKALLTQPDSITSHFRPGGGGSGYSGTPLIDPGKAVYRPEGSVDGSMDDTGLVTIQLREPISRGEMRPHPN